MKEMEMRIIYVGWIGMLLICFSFFSTALAGDSVKAPGVQIKANGSVVAPGVKVGPNGNVSAPGVKINSSNRSAAVKGPGGGYAIENNSQTLNLTCNGEAIAVNGNDNTINCQGKSPSLNVNGKGNTIHFKGTCDQLNMNGSDNRADMERIGSITVQGSGNRITWVAASSGPKPRIVSQGKNMIKKAE